MPAPLPDPAFCATVRALFNRLSPLAAAQRDAALAAADVSAAVKAEVRSLLVHADLAEADVAANGPGCALGAAAAAGAAGAAAPCTGAQAGFLDQPAVALAADLLQPPLAEPAKALHPGQRLGPWLIDGLLGRGGVGEVWARCG